MKKYYIILVMIGISYGHLSAADLNSEMIDLAKIYRNFLFRNTPNESTYKHLESFQSPELQIPIDFIRETITTANALATEKYLMVPDSADLMYIYIIRQITLNLSEEPARDNFQIISELKAHPPSRYNLIDNYYEMLFMGIGNKNQPFDLSKVNFELFKYGFTDDTEKAIFFFQAMNLCGTSIWGYMNIVKPPNYKKAMEYIEKFPEFNGQPYYQYKDFSFPDFEMEILKDQGKESYKAYYIDKFYDTLLSHLECLSQKKKNNDERLNLILGSILLEDQYYIYSSHTKDLESLFRTVKR